MSAATGANPLFFMLLAAWATAGLAACVGLLCTAAPYGRHVRPGWGPRFCPRLSWFLMESPPVFLFAALFAVGWPHAPVLMLFWTLWMIHYTYRGLVYPAILRSTRQVPLFIIVSAIGFHLANANLCGWELFLIKPDRPASWLGDPRFLIGLGMFVLGFSVAVTADRQLLRLRSERGTEYKIPRGGLFERVSSANYLGEIVEWTGWAVMTWTWSGLVFALWVMANLVPRGLAHHRWYQANFPDYPPDRKALIPYIL